jgi:endonuclease-3
MRVDKKGEIREKAGSQEPGRVPVEEILRILEKTYAGEAMPLVHRNAFELFIATILSAQCTDTRVNKVTPALFRCWSSPEDFAKADLAEIEEAIRTCGLYKAKARNIKEACRILVERHGSSVPDRREALEALPGVGRKTAGVILCFGHGKEAFPVDTHVFRVVNRLGLASSRNVRGTERDLMEKVPSRLWSRAHRWLIFHGRRVCRARKPLCGECPLQTLCRYYRAQA